jgi:hypothetical protein
MIDVEPLIREALVGLDPLPHGIEVNWQDVLGRVQQPIRSRPRVARRPLQVAIAILLALVIASVASPLGAAIGRTFGDFSAWISGSPGKPASRQAQQAFEKANARGWVGFPPGTRLRKLIETRASGSTFTLFGFRSGDALCLRLVATGPAAGANQSCAPLQALQSAKEPALVVATDEPFGLPRGRPRSPNYKPQLASATFGIASDGVKKVVLQADDGRHQAIVASNAFLYIDQRPKPGVYTRSAEAVAANGSTTHPLLVVAPHGANGTPAPGHVARPTGPTQVERQVSGGTVSWIQHRRDRGQPIDPSGLKHLRVGAVTDVTFARAVQPDPANPARVAFLVGKPARDPFHRFQPGQQQLCVFFVPQGRSGSGSCSALPLRFGPEPFSFDSYLFGSGAQFDYFSGIVSDDVAQLKIFLTNSTIEDVPLKDNAFAAPVARALFPVRVVAYDSASRIIGIDTVGEPNTAPPSPVKGGAWKTIRHAVAADGTSATISTALARGGGLCWRIRFSDGLDGGPALCLPPYRAVGEPPVNLVVQDTRGGAFIYGRVSSDVTSVAVHYRDGRKTTARPSHGLVLVAAPQRVKPPANPVAEIIGLNRSGRQIGSEDYSHTPALPPPERP